MSLTSRTAYLASLADEVNSKLGPLQEQHAQIAITKNSMESNLSNQVSVLNNKIQVARLSGNTALENSLEKYKDNLISNTNEEISSSINAMVASIQTTANSVLEETDGVSGTITVSETSFGIDVQPDLINRTTDLVTNSITDPNTIVNINTTVTGTAGGDPIVGGVGTQIANIQTD